jgi:hypothetical protein
MTLIAINAFMVVSNLLNLVIKTHFVRESEYTSTVSTKSALCTQVIKSILKKEVHPYMVSKDIKTALIESDYKALGLKFRERIHHVFVLTDSCKVIIEDQIGLRALNFKLEESALNAFYYKVVQITETDIQEEE